MSDVNHDNGDIGWDRGAPPRNIYGVMATDIVILGVVGFAICIAFVGFGYWLGSM